MNRREFVFKSALAMPALSLTTSLAIPQSGRSSQQHPKAKAQTDPAFGIFLHGLFALDFRNPGSGSRSLSIYSPDCTQPDPSCPQIQHPHIYIARLYRNKKWVPDSNGNLEVPIKGSYTWSSTSPSQVVPDLTNIPLLLEYGGIITSPYLTLNVPLPDFSLSGSDYAVVGLRRLTRKDPINPVTNTGSLTGDIYPSVAALLYQSMPSGGSLLGFNLSSGDHIHIYAQPDCNGAGLQHGHYAWCQLNKMLGFQPANYLKEPASSLPPGIDTPPITAVYGPVEEKSYGDLHGSTCHSKEAKEAKHTKPANPTIFAHELPTCIPLGVL